jgi:hypothetical protein
MRMELHVSCAINSHNYPVTVAGRQRKPLESDVIYMHINTEIAKTGLMDVELHIYHFMSAIFFSYVPFVNQPREILDGIDYYIVVTNTFRINGEF